MLWAMKTPRMLSGCWVSLVLLAAGIAPAAAELATLDQTEYLGYFAVFANARYQFKVASDGKIALWPIGEKREPVALALSVPIQIAVEELMPDGKIAVKQIQSASLESVQPPTLKLEKIVITGKVAGDATFEVDIEQSRGTIFMGGRVTNPGTLKNTLRFAIYAKMPSLYTRSANAKTMNKKDESALQKKIAGDHVTLKGIDGKHRKEPFDKRVDASSPEISGAGLISADVETAAYVTKGPSKKFQFVAGPNSMLTLKNEQGGPLHEGFTIRWEADKAKDPDGKARFAFEVK